MDNYLGEIRTFSCNFAPRGWALANGASLPVMQNQALYSLLGIVYGSNSVNGSNPTMFNLPDLRGRVPVGFTPSGVYPLGQMGGEEEHVLLIDEMPAHNHLLSATNQPADSDSSANGMLAATQTGHPLYVQASTPSSLVALNPTMVTNAGGSQGHSNMQPSLALNFCIAIQGIYPTQQ